MCKITLSIPDEALAALKVSPEQLGAELRLAAAIKLYELGRLSSGAAAKLAGVPGTRCGVPVAWLRATGHPCHGCCSSPSLPNYGVDTFRLTEEQLARETRLARIT